MGATLLQFAQINDAAAATTKKLQKQWILADYFHTLNDDDLRLAVRYANGRAFPSTDERTLNVGWATINGVVLPILNIDPQTYYDLVVRNGDTGEALSTVWPAQSSTNPLHLSDLSAAFTALASTGKVERKQQLLYDLYIRCHHPREAAYLTKIIFHDMRTGVQEGVLQAAIASAFNHPLPQIQRCQLLVGDLDEVALLAKSNTLASAQFKLFHPIQFMLATPQETAEDTAKTIAGQTFFAEDKLDGIRAQIHKTPGRIAIYTRTMDRTDQSFPDVVAAIGQLPGEFLLDGEIVPFRDGVVLPFAHIQKRLGRKMLTARTIEENPAAFIAFDLLYLNGQLLMDRPLHHRRQQLEQLIGPNQTSPDATNVDAIQSRHDLLLTTLVQVTTAVDIESAFARSRQSRNEGLVLKNPNSIYSPGRRGKMWLKLKTHLPTFDCVVTAAEYGHGKRKNSLSDYTFAVWDRDPTLDGATLVNVGKAYSGVTDEEIAQLTKLFHDLSIVQQGHRHLVRPQLVLEVACDQIQKSNRHASGYAMRFPRIKRLRWDKKPEDADRLDRVIEVYNSTHNFGKSGEPAIEKTLFDDLP